MTNQKTIAVLIPCFNEELTIGKVVQDFKKQLPEATIYVFDNNSTDKTAEAAQGSGAIVEKEKRRGKGFVVAAMLAKVQADYYIMVDGDDTYPAASVHDLLNPLHRGEADMVVGRRLATDLSSAFRRFHVLGNRLVVSLINLIFSSQLHDVMSGYRAFTREVALNLPVVASGFDVETELTLQLLYRNFVIREIPVDYRERPPGSVSKLSTFRDGFRVLVKILGIFIAYKPLTFFSGLSIMAFLAGVPFYLLTGWNILFKTNYAGNYSLIIGISSLFIAILLVSAGVVVHALNFRILEMTHVIAKQIESLKTRKL